MGAQAMSLPADAAPRPIGPKGWWGGLMRWAGSGRIGPACRRVDGDA